MPHVSTKKVSKKMLAQAEMLIDSFLIDSGIKTRKRMFRELFTPTERLMLAKRLLMIFLIHKGISAYKIGRFLGVSQTTVARYETLVDRGAFSRSLPFLRMNTKVQRALNFIADLLMIPFNAYGKSLSQVMRERDNS